MKTRDEDFVSQLIIESTHTYLLCFTNTGRVYWLKIYEVPDVGITGKGKAMASLVDLQPGEKVVTILPVKNLSEEGKNILFATRNGTVKKTPLKDFSNVMTRGIIAINIEKDDELITANITDGQQVIFLATHDGMAIRFNEQDLRPMGRPATGNRGINLRKGDYVIGAAVTPSPEAREEPAPRTAADLGLTTQLEAVIGAEPTPDCHPEAQPRRPASPSAPPISSVADASPPPTARKSSAPTSKSTPPPRPSSTSSTKSSASPPASSSPSAKTASASAPTSTATASSPAAAPASST